MSLLHGVYVNEADTSASTPVEAPTGIPVYIGLSPIQAAENPAAAGVPVLVTSFTEFKELLGWSDNWTTYPLCEAAYAHFKLFGVQPAVFINMLDLSTMKSAHAAADVSVTSHKVSLGANAIDSDALIVKKSGGTGTAYVKDTDYSVYFDSEGNLIVELLSGSTHYAETGLNIAYDEATPASVTTNVVVTGLDAIDLCATTLGLVPDLIVAPGFSDTATVGAAMAAKAASISGLFRAKAVVDLSTSNATTYTAAITLKSSVSYIDENQIVCWPMVALDSLKFHMSVIAAGTIAATDAEYGSPYVSPSNKNISGTGLVLADGTAVNLTLAHANSLNSAGIVTALNFMGGLKLWGNYTGCYPSDTDVKNIFIPVSRMFDWVANTLIQTFWSRLDDPMNRRLIDSILDSANIWINGLVGSGALLGGRVEMLDSDNPTSSLMAGIVKLHVYLTPPSPAQEIDFTLEYDATYVTEALS